MNQEEIRCIDHWHERFGSAMHSAPSMRKFPFLHLTVIFNHD